MHRIKGHCYPASSLSAVMLNGENMCYRCYKEYGEPKIVNEKTKAAAKLADAVYEFNCVGGNCHSVLDDFNIENHSIDFCLNYVIPENIHGHTQEQLKIERECMLAFRDLSEDERVSALAIHEGWVET